MGKAPNTWINYASDITSIEVSPGVSANPDSSNLFSNLPNVTNIDISNLDTSDVTDMSHMFENDTNLKTIDFGDSLDANDVTTMEDMFKNCESLETIDLNKIDTSEKLKDISGMFEGDKNIADITFGDNFDTSGVTDMHNLFKDCTSLTELDLSHFDTGSATDMSGMFEGDTGLTSIIFKDENGNSEFDTSNVTNMENMFKDCEKLTELDLTGFDTGNVTDMSGMFEGCDKLEEIKTDDSFDTSNVTDISGIFDGCDKLDKDKIGFDFENNNKIPEPNFEGNENVKVDPETGKNEVETKVEYNPSAPTEIPIIDPTNGSGVYEYEIKPGGAPEGTKIEDGKIILPEGLEPGEYEVTVVIKDDLTGKETEVTYIITVGGNITDPQNVTLTGGEEKVYGEKNTTLTCSTTSTYESGVSLYYSFGYSSEEGKQAGNFTEANTNNTYNVPNYVGNRYYVCKIYAYKDKDHKSSTVLSNSQEVKIKNVAIVFNSNGGTINGSPVVTKYTHKDANSLYEGEYNETKATIPTVKRLGYAINGWYTETSGGEKVLNKDGSFAGQVTGYTNGSVWTLTDNKILYAQYEKINPKEIEISYYEQITSLRAYLNTYKDVTLKFSKAARATGYRVCYKKSSEKNYKCNDKASLGGVNLAPGTKYDFMVTPYKKVNGKIYPSPNTKTVSIYTLKKMNPPKVKKASSKKVKVTLSKINGATGYEIYTSKKKNKGYKKQKQ